MKKYILLLLAFLALASTDSSAQLKPKWGGTGKKTLTTNAVLIGNGTSAIKATTAAGADSGKFLMSNGASATPTWQTASGGSSSSRAVFAGSTNVTTSSRYFHPNGLTTLNTTSSATDPRAAAIIPFAGTIKTFKALTETATGTGGDTITIYKNGSVAANIGIAEGATTGSNTSTTVSVSAGDLISVRWRVAAGNGSFIAWAFEFLATP
jgi:hypothetical protein